MRISDQTTRGGSFEFGYALDISAGGSRLVSSAKRQRRLFSTDWDYVVMEVVVVVVVGGVVVGVVVVVGVDGCSALTGTM
jgi:hypothetical protein